MNATPDGFTEPKEKSKTRPVREIVQENALKWGGRTRKVVEDFVIPFINSDAVANPVQENALWETVDWVDGIRDGTDENRFVFITMLNTLRG